MTSMKPGPRNVEEMKQFYAFIVRKSFYGYEPPAKSEGLTEYDHTGLRLREFFLPEVIDYVKKAFGSKVFIDDQISSSTNLLIVPDNWDRRLPMSAIMYAKNLKYIPFSFVLHPSVRNRKNVRSLMVPRDAKYQILHNKTSENEKATYFELKEVSPDDIIQSLKGWNYDTGNTQFLKKPTNSKSKDIMSALTPSMKTSSTTKITTTKTPTAKSSTAPNQNQNQKKNSTIKKTSSDTQMMANGTKKTSQVKTITQQKANIDSMVTMPKKSSKSSTQQRHTNKKTMMMNREKNAQQTHANNAWKNFGSKTSDAKKQSAYNKTMAVKGNNKNPSHQNSPQKTTVQKKESHTKVQMKGKSQTMHNNNMVNSTKKKSSNNSNYDLTDEERREYNKAWKTMLDRSHTQL